MKHHMQEREERRERCKFLYEWKKKRRKMNTHTHTKTKDQSGYREEESAGWIPASQTTHKKGER